MFRFGYKKRFEKMAELCDSQLKEVARLSKENKVLAAECNDLKAELKDMALHLTSLGLINGCLMEVVTEDQKKVVGKKIKIKEATSKKEKKNAKKQ